MTQITDDTPIEWPMPAIDSNLDVLTRQSNDYLRRIHWWVRLFGIIWIVIPIVATLAGIAFFVGAIAGATDPEPAGPTSYEKCVSEAVYRVADCARMYPRS